eukprot:7995697-Karenia_brevis.AAC.1
MSLLQDVKVKSGGFDWGHQFKLEEVFLALNVQIIKSSQNTRHSSRQRFQNFTRSQTIGLNLTTGSLSTCQNLLTSDILLFTKDVHGPLPFGMHFAVVPTLARGS